MAQHTEDGHGGCVICHEYVPHTDDEYIRVSWPCPASRLPDYEAAVEALEIIVAGLNQAVVVENASSDWWNATEAADAALARLRESVPA